MRLPVFVLFRRFFCVIFYYYGAVRCSYGARAVLYGAVRYLSVSYGAVRCLARSAGPCVVRCSSGVEAARDVRCAPLWFFSISMGAIAVSE